MGCNSKTLSKSRTCWTLFNVSSLFIPYMTVETNKYEEVRPAFLIQSSTDPVKARPAVQYSDDGIIWGAATEFGPAMTSTANAWHYGDTYASIASAKRYARFGVNCARDAGSSGRTQYAHITLKLDMREA